MTQLLISVTTVQEAQLAIENGVDIIDLKDPNAGALGALPLSQIETVVAYVNGEKPISATIGDLPMQAELIFDSVIRLASTKVDFIKIGFFQTEDYQPVLDKLKTITAKGVRLVAVLFAEFEYSDNLIHAIKNAGFSGIMLDTAQKNGATFMYYLTAIKCKKIAKKVLNFEMSFGLAGSLQLQHIVAVKRFNPTYMGFRGGVCADNVRISSLNAGKIKAIRDAL